MTGTLDAVRYDAWFDAPWGRYASRVERQALLGVVGPLTGRQLLDVGCGTGRFAAAFERAGAEVTGVDRDAGMLALAASRVAGPLVEADAHALPFPDAGFDVSVAVTLLEFADRPEQIIDELVRIIRPGGRLVVASLNPASPWGLAHRRELQRPPWFNACLRSRDELHDLLAGRGRVRQHAALYAPGALPALPTYGPVLERIGRLFPAAGAFQIAVIDR